MGRWVGGEKAGARNHDCGKDSVSVYVGDSVGEKRKEENDGNESSHIAEEFADVPGQASEPTALPDFRAFGGGVVGTRVGWGRHPVFRLAFHFLVSSLH